MHKPVVGVMGASANDALSAAEAARVQSLAEQLGAAIAQTDCFLVTGATTGLPGMVATSFRKHGGFALGISPAENRQEHVARYDRIPALGENSEEILKELGYDAAAVIHLREEKVI